MNTIYTPVKPYKIPETIVQQIKALIKEGKLKVGEQLPPERTLAELMGVGRSSLREALNILVTLGFVEVRKRKGIFVRNAQAANLVNTLRKIPVEDKRRISDLQEIRKEVETIAAYWAAERRTKNDLVSIRKFIKKMEGDAKKGHNFLSDDMGFHLAIAQATQNSFRSYFLNAIFELSYDHYDLVRHKFTRYKNNIPLVLDHHTRIFQAIEQGDSKGAQASMEEHLVWLGEAWNEFWLEEAQRGMKQN